MVQRLDFDACEKIVRDKMEEGVKEGDSITQHYERRAIRERKKGVLNKILTGRSKRKLVYQPSHEEQVKIMVFDDDYMELGEEIGEEIEEQTEYEVKLIIKTDCY